MKNLRVFFSNTMLILLVISYFVISGIMYFGEGGLLDIWKLSGMLIPDLSITHSQESLSEMFTKWGPQCRLYYIRYQYRDFIYPIIYSVLMTGILIRLIQPVSPNIWVIIPSLAMIFDFAENYFLRVLVYDFPNFIPEYISYASLFSTLKWGSILFSFILIIIALINRRKKYAAQNK